MAESTVLTVLITTVTGFVLGAGYYAVLGGRLAAARGDVPAKPSPGILAVEVVRCLVLAGVVTWLAGQVGVDTWAAGLLLGLVLWVGFPAVLWVGAIVHEKSPWRLAAIHAGDWLVKLLVLGTVVGLLR